MIGHARSSTIVGRRAWIDTQRKHNSG